MKKIYIGIDLGGTNVKIGCFDSGLNLIDRTSAATQSDMGPQDIVDRIGQAIEQLLRENSLTLKSVNAAGIGAPGPANLDEGIIIASPNMPTFKNVPLRKMISDKLSAETVLENDANAACWGEFVLGAGKNVSDMVFFTLGTGIGGGIVTDGKLVHGSRDNAAELGHIIIYPDGRKCGCGQKGCAEAHASADSTAKRATEAIQQGAESSLKEILEQNGRITSKDIYQHLAEGDALAKKITDGTAETLALLCINVLHTTDPGRIVFSGGMTAAGELLLRRIKNFFNKYIWSLKRETVEITFATLGEDAGITGAAALAKLAKEK